MTKLDDQDITAKLVGKHVTIISVDLFKEAIAREGIISAIKPGRTLTLSHVPGGGMIVFAGMSESIYNIVDDNGKELYRNEAVLNAYKGKFLEKDSARDALREQGVFYLDD